LVKQLPLTIKNDSRKSGDIFSGERSERKWARRQMIGTTMNATGVRKLSRATRGGGKTKAWRFNSTTECTAAQDVTSV